MLPALLLGVAALGASPPPPPPRALFRCQPGPGAQGGPPPPPPNATSCVALGCRWDGQHCALRSPFARLLFADEFEGRAVNGSSWAVWDYRANMSPGRVRTNAAADMVYAADAVSVGGGALTITSARHAAPLRVAPNASAHYTTGRLQTQSRRSWGPYGQFEARARVPRARGTNNAVWLMPQSFGSGASTYTEFDIAEILGRDSNISHGTYHWGAPAGPLHHRSGGEYIDKAGLSEGFHMCDHCPRSNLCSLAHPAGHCRVATASSGRRAPSFGTSMT